MKSIRLWYHAAADMHTNLWYGYQIMIWKSAYVMNIRLWYKHLLIILLWISDYDMHIRQDKSHQAMISPWGKTHQFWQKQHPIVRRNIQSMSQITYRILWIWRVGILQISVWQLADIREPFMESSRFMCGNIAGYSQNICIVPGECSADVLLQNIHRKLHCN